MTVARLPSHWRGAITSTPLGDDATKLEDPELFCLEPVLAPTRSGLCSYRVDAFKKKFHRNRLLNRQRSTELARAFQHFEAVAEFGTA